ncbi:phosphate transport ATP-binding protein PstB [Bacillus sp. JCM 19047]|nr:phosphate transport ATP-binding protein PstB [Bacillus sp. JCM 19047]
MHDSALELSGGQQQRLCIARTLALKPEVILLDEPASALDPIATAKVEELMIELKKQYTVVVVTHNMQQASRVSDRTAFFYNGELIETNPTEKLFSNLIINKQRLIFLVDLGKEETFAMVATLEETKSVYSVRDFNLWYGQNHALKNINLDLHEKEVTAIIGPSGCGKSTFIKTLNLMSRLNPTIRMSGELNYRQDNLLHSSMDLAELRKHVGMVFQKPNPFPKSIYENVAYGPRVHGVRKKKELDERVELSLKGAFLWDEVKDRLNKNAMGLSGGQQQRLCIARALATKPEVLLMDEPTSALDPLSTTKIEELISNLKGTYTVVIVTHNMQQAARISDKTAFFYMGELIEMDDTRKIFSNPEHKRTEAYISGQFG